MVAIEALKNGRIFVLLKNMGHSKIVGVSIYLIGVDWEHFKMPIKLKVETINGMSFKELSPSEEIALYCHNHEVIAKHILALRVICYFEDKGKVAHTYTTKVV
ncbi:MAG: hypothetical protein DRZ82_07685 [Thermoprotei archaeon]|nr:MAG: hypothetical protein DRZ82_07685 [Thermoprotei archaeon]